MKSLQALTLFCLAPVLLSACGDGSDPAVIAPQGKSAQPAAAAPAAVTVFTAFELPDSANQHRAYCALDQINQQKAVGQVINVEAGSTANFRGWVGDWGRRVPRGFRIVLSGATTYGIDAVAGGLRPDVARALKTETLRNSGFNVQAPMGDVAPGEYEVSIVLKSGNQFFARCNTTTRVVVVQAPG